jgi:DNA-binding NtrC family response regulator
MELPPLRDRRTDIPILWAYFSKKAMREEARPALIAPPRILTLLMRHDWPGNVRELENIARHVAAVASGPEIVEADLPAHLAPEQLDKKPAAIAIPGMTLEEVERIAILRTYEAMKRNARAAAEVLGISVRTMHYRLKRYGEEGFLDEPDRRRATSVPGVAPRIDSSSGRTRPRLLLAEDDGDVRWTLAELLSEEGFEVVAVSSGSAMLEALGSAFLFEEHPKPDVIVADIRMPGMTGLEALEGVRAKGWKIPVVLITAFGDEQIRAYARSLEAELIEKPISLDLLRTAVRRVVPGLPAES